VGSSQPIGFPIVVLSTAVAEALEEMNAQLEEKLAAGKDHRSAVLSVIRKAVKETKAIRFEGNGYSDDWKTEAEARGLPHAKDTAAALPIFEQEASRVLFTKFGILTEHELEARLHIRHEQYHKTITIEAQVLREIAETMLLPSILEDLRRRADTLGKLAAVGIAIPASIKAALEHQTSLAGIAQERLAALKVAMVKAEAESDMKTATQIYGTTVREAQESLRDALDQLEKDCAAELWPIPVYRELMAPLI
jgi:glutamine synthetase